MASPILPSSAQPIADVRGNKAYVSQTWQRFFNAFVSQALPSVPSTLPASPAGFMASGTGHYLVVGGTVSSITLQRGQEVLPTGLTGGFIPVANGDVVTVTYSVAPTVTFVPY